MNLKLVVYIVIIVALGMYLFQEDRVEAQNGALLQLVAKGPQDTYLTGDAWKYAPWWYYGPYYYPYRRRGFWYPGRYRYIGKYPYYRRRFW